MNRIAVILPAAGVGKRFTQALGESGSGKTGRSKSGGISGGGTKIEQDLGGRPVFLRAVELFLKQPGVVQVIVAVHPQMMDEFRFRWGEKLAFLGVQVIAGGIVERWETVLKALAAVQADVTHVAIHDAARPLASPQLIQRCLAACERYSAVIPGIAASATLKKVELLSCPQAEADPTDFLLRGDAPSGEGQDVIKKAGGSRVGLGMIKKVVGTVDRRELVEVQTPQVYEIGLLKRAYAQIEEGKISGQGVTDDAMLVEQLGETVAVVEGESTNFKITRPEDLDLARAWVAVQDQKQKVVSAKKRLFADDEEE